MSRAAAPALLVATVCLSSLLGCAPAPERPVEKTARVISRIADPNSDLVESYLLKIPDWHGELQLLPGGRFVVPGLPSGAGSWLYANNILHLDWNDGEVIVLETNDHGATFRADDGRPMKLISRHLPEPEPRMRTR